jgi:hypothetical protein
MFTIKNESGRYSPDVTPISGFDLSKKSIISSDWRFSTGRDYGHEGIKIMLMCMELTTHSPISDSQNLFQVFIMDENHIAIMWSALHSSY